MMHSFVALAVIGVLWVIVGYSLTFGKNVLGGFIGWDWNYFFLKAIDESIAERVTFKGYVLFIASWFILVYCPLAHWIWATDGWLYNSRGSD